MCKCVRTACKRVYVQEYTKEAGQKPPTLHNRKVEPDSLSAGILTKQQASEKSPHQALINYITMCMQEEAKEQASDQRYGNWHVRGNSRGRPWGQREDKETDTNRRNKRRTKRQEEQREGAL